MSAWLLAMSQPHGVRLRYCLHLSAVSSYTGPRHFTTISLTSLLLKTKVRLVDRYLKDNALALMSLHSNQDACHAGKSMAIALCCLIVRAEKAIDQQETVQGVFLDKEWGFTYTILDSMCDTLVRHVWPHHCPVD